MKLSCLPVSFFADILGGRMSLSEWARMGRELGLDAVDLSILFVPDRSAPAVAAMRRAVEAESMRIAMVTSYPDFTHPDASTARPGTGAGARGDRGGGGTGRRNRAGDRGPGPPRDQPGGRHRVGRRRAAAGLRSGRGAQASRWRYENHAKPGVWQYTDFCQPPDIFLEIARRTEGSGLGINFDVGNAATFCVDPLALLEAVLPRVVSIHASDSAVHGALQHVLLGTGVTPYPALFGRLAHEGWDGWICMEEASYGGREGVAAAAAYVRETWDAAVSAQREPSGEGVAL